MMQSSFGLLAAAMLGSAQVANAFYPLEVNPQSFAEGEG
jgi:hypothetical protein